MNYNNVGQLDLSVSELKMVAIDFLDEKPRSIGYLREKLQATEARVKVVLESLVLGGQVKRIGSKYSLTEKGRRRIMNKRDQLNHDNVTLHIMFQYIMCGKGNLWRE